MIFSIIIYIILNLLYHSMRSHIIIKLFYYLSRYIEHMYMTTIIYIHMFNIIDAYVNANTNNYYNTSEL